MVGFSYFGGNSGSECLDESYSGLIFSLSTAIEGFYLDTTETYHTLSDCGRLYSSCPSLLNKEATSTNKECNFPICFSHINVKSVSESFYDLFTGARWAVSKT